MGYIIFEIPYVSLLGRIYPIPRFQINMTDIKSYRLSKEETILQAINRLLALANICKTNREFTKISEFLQVLDDTTSQFTQL